MILGEWILQKTDDDGYIISNDDDVFHLDEKTDIEKLVKVLNEKESELRQITSEYNGMEDALEEEHYRLVELQKYVTLKGLKDEFLKWQKFLEIKGVNIYKV